MTLTHRDDFPSSVKTVLAARVGHQCSNPSCPNHTSGPHTDPNKALNLGVAAHITAAAPGGPRYDASLTSMQRSNIANGIWLCQLCAKLVDNDPVRYGAEILREWKSKRELEMHDVVTKSVTKVEGSDQICFLLAADALRALTESNFLFQFDGEASNYRQLLSDNLRRLFFHAFKKHVLSGNTNRMLISGREGSGKTFNTLLLALQLSEEGYRVFYCRDILLSSLTPEHLRGVALRNDHSLILIIDNVQHDISKAQSLIAAITQTTSYEAKPVFLFLTRPLDTDTVIDAFGKTTPVINILDRMIDFERLVGLFFHARGIRDSASDFLTRVGKVQISGLLLKYRNMALWNEILRSLPADGSHSLAEDQVLKRVHSFIRRKEHYVLDARVNLSRLLPLFSQGLAIPLLYAFELIGDHAPEILHALEQQELIRMVELDWESSEYGGTSVIAVHPILHQTKARLLIQVFRKYYEDSVSPENAIADYAERYQENFHYILGVYQDYDEFRALFNIPRIRSTARKYLAQRHLGNKHYWVLLRLAFLPADVRASILDESVLDGLAEKLNGQTAYIVSKVNTLRGLYKADGQKALELFKRLDADALSADLLNPKPGRERSDLYFFVKAIEVFKNISVASSNPIDKVAVQSYVRQMIDKCRVELTRRFENDPYITQLHWLLKRLGPLDLGSYFLEGIEPEFIFKLIATKDVNSNELERIFLTARKALWTQPDGSRVPYSDILVQHLSYDDMKRIFDNPRSSLVRLVMAARDGFITPALVRYADEVDFEKKVRAANAYQREYCLQQLEWITLKSEDREKLMRLIDLKEDSV